MNKNILIGKFMGYKNSFHPTLELKNPEYCRWYHPNDLGEMFFSEELIYETSWDWLMPVIEKIESENHPSDELSKYTFNYRRYKECYECCIQDNISTEFIFETQAITKIEATYGTVVKFIEWYNKKEK